ncbi:MAG: 30S ribosomal protein S6 [Patescibacteria group bacterium]|nr:30S ribosomal protein S6 [Patescibacteria group bacterium]
MEFEINFLVLQSQTENLEALREKVKKIIEERGGKVTDKLEYRKRKLSYQIKHELYGFFSVFRFDMEDGGLIEKVKKDLNLQQDIARYIIVKTDELPALKKEIVPEQQEKRQMEEKGTIKQAEVDKILSEKEAAPSKPEIKEKESKQELEKKKEPKKELTEKEKEPNKEKKEEKAKEDKSTLEDLDKKLDEILSI